MQLKIFLIIIFLLVASPALAINPQCLQAELQVYSNCSDVKKNYIFSKNPLIDCGSQSNERICCCPATIVNQAKPKYLLIGSIVAFFAIITTFALFNKRNE